MYTSLTTAGPQQPTLANIDGPAERFRVSHPPFEAKLWHRWPLGTQQILLVLYVAVILVFAGSANGPMAPKGLIVRLQAGQQSTAGIQPVYIFVRDMEHVLVDGQPVAAEGVAPVLRAKLRLRHPDWPVYVEGNGDLEWQRVAHVIDVARGMQARVVLLARRPGKP